MSDYLTDAEHTFARKQIAERIDFLRAENRAAEQRIAAQRDERNATQARLEEQHKQYRKAQS
jgi:hypothetical protein